VLQYRIDVDLGSHGLSAPCNVGRGTKSPAHAQLAVGAATLEAGRLQPA